MAGLMREKRSFNPRPRVGGDLQRGIKSFIDGTVSIHAPAWGATSRNTPPSLHSSRFNPRPRVGGDVERDPTLVRQLSVSIHAPAWGATVSLLIGGKSPVVSIHAPAWGATRDWMGSCARTRRFNPRPRVGGDASVSANVCPSTVSIHAPAWGATGSAIPPYLQVERFNPRPRVGGD